ncbi:MAG: hypothetical protein GAK43_01118 [Stenotrophomonas maltophilia]|nr:MAG: hypothetical protein GAK43_01118 [Stenotrophomonas maltophilia]
MPTEIGAIRALPVLPTLRNPQAAAQVSLKLNQSLEDLLPPGQSAQAEVLAVREDPPLNFQMLLRLTLASGQQALVTADSTQSLPRGSLLNVATANAATTLSATLLDATTSTTTGTGSRNAPLTSLDLEQMPVGTLLQAKVLTSTAIPATAGREALFRVVASLLNTSQAGQLLSLESLRPLRPGSLLSAQVQDNQTLQFLPLSSRLTRLDQFQQLGTQQTRQASPEALLDTLQNVQRNPDLPAPLRSAITQLLGNLPDARQLSDPRGVAQAIQQSGSFLEAHLLQGGEALGSDFKGNLLRLVSLLLPDPAAGPQVLANLANSNAANLARSLPSFVRNALGTLDQNSNRRLQDLAFPLPSRTLNTLEDEGDLEMLLKLAGAAIARLQSHQLSSLVQSDSLPDGTKLNTWQVEIPMRNQETIVPLQVRIQQEERETPQERSKERREADAPRESLWRLDLAFDLDPLGPLQVQTVLASSGLSGQLWAERESTVQLVGRELGTLRSRLSQAGLIVTDLSCHQGRAPQGQRTALEQRWVDEKA